MSVIYWKPGIPRILTLDKYERLLRSPSIPIRDVGEISKVVKLLQNALVNSKMQVGFEGVGLSAIQIGLRYQIFIAEVSGELRTFVNPTLEILDSTISIEEEGCLSIPDIEVPVPRKTKVRIRAYDEKLQPFSIELEGFDARVVQHEYDHLLGKLIVDYVG